MEASKLSAKRASLPPLRQGNQDKKVSDDGIDRANRALQRKIKQEQDGITGNPIICRDIQTGGAWAHGYGINRAAIKAIRQIAGRFELGEVRIFDPLQG